MAKQGWDRLLSDLPDFRKPGRYPIAAYSEFMPAPRIGWRAYGGDQPAPRDPDNPFAWQVSEREEAFELQPGMEQIARQVLGALRRLDLDQAAQGISRARLEGNVYWPEELARQAGALPHERYVILAPLALSLTQDDKGRVRWTFFGSSEQGPDRAFWKSFYTAPGREIAPEYAVDFIRRLLGAAYGEPPHHLADLRRAGFRILPGSGEKVHPLWAQGTLPDWTRPFLLRSGEPIGEVKYLLTFRPFGSLPRGVRKAYLDGKLHILPFPGSLVFWGATSMLKLERQLPLAMQVALLNVCDRHEAVRGLRVPQSGWMHEPHADLPEPNHHLGRVRNTYRRTSRWARIERHQDELAGEGLEDRITKVLFSSNPQDVGLYGKPMARNSQIWTEQYELVLDGPRAGEAELLHAAEVLDAGGQFGYRFFFPPMLVGKYEVFWHRPLVAWLDQPSGEARVLSDAPAGYLTAYDGGPGELERPVELWPDMLMRPEYVAAVHGYSLAFEHHDHQLALNVHRLLELRRLGGRRVVPRSLARQVLTIAKDLSIDHFLEEVAEWKPAEGYGYLLHHTLCRMIAPQSDPSLGRLPHSITFPRTATRAFEKAYWKTIANLAHGRYLNKDNADCVLDEASKPLLKHARRDLEALAEHLVAYYRKTIARCGMEGQAEVGDLPFSWQTDFDFDWMEGWRANQPRSMQERNLLVRIPGRDRSEAVIMADHYDTAYMEDLYYPSRGGKLARVAAAGADDNHSATAALMLAAPVFLELSRKGQLGCDVWLVHLTGEEFPADCLGARHLAQSLVEGTLKLRAGGKKRLSLSQTAVKGVYVLDMIAHNREHDRDTFQISPGQGRQSLWLAEQAHVANMIWNAGIAEWNERPDRRQRGRGERSADPRVIPPVAQYPHLDGEVRTPGDPRSSLFNTDGQIFSDAGVPVVLFMENYDINRVGYHDTHDTMANIDLDYGAAVAAIAIESVARAASAARGA